MPCRVVNVLSVVEMLCLGILSSIRQQGVAGFQDNLTLPKQASRGNCKLQRLGLWLCLHAAGMFCTCVSSSSWRSSWPTLHRVEAAQGWTWWDTWSSKRASSKHPELNTAVLPQYGSTVRNWQRCIESPIAQGRCAAPYRHWYNDWCEAHCTVQAVIQHSTGTDTMIGLRPTAISLASCGIVLRKHHKALYVIGGFRKQLLHSQVAFSGLCKNLLDLCSSGMSCAALKERLAQAPQRSLRHSGLLEAAATQSGGLQWPDKCVCFDREEEVVC